MPSSFRRNVRSWQLAMALLALLGGTSCSRTEYQVAAFTRHGPIASDIIDEASGLAVSRRDPNILWTHNDSDGQPVLYAIDLDGKLRGSIRLAGVKNRDWEDMASFELDGRAWLLVADTGDNKGMRTDQILHVVAEPDPATLSPQNELTVPVAWSIPVQYEDGPHDCEAVAVDTFERKIYLLTKRTEPPALYSLLLRPAADGKTAMAKRIGSVTRLPQPSTEQSLLPIPTGRYRGEPTAMDFSRDRKFAIVLTYGDVLLFPRGENDTWPKALARKPQVLPPHGLGQAEAAAISPDGHDVFVTGEQLHPPLLHYHLQSKAP